MLTPRPYQSRVVEDLWTYFNTHPDGNPVGQEIRDLECKTMLGDVANMKRQMAEQGFESQVVA